MTTAVHYVLENEYRLTKMVQEWRELHTEELLTDWDLTEQKKALFAINPLE